MTGSGSAGTGREAVAPVGTIDDVYGVKPWTRSANSSLSNARRVSVRVWPERAIAITNFAAASSGNDVTETMSYRSNLR